METDVWLSCLSCVTLWVETVSVLCDVVSGDCLTLSLSCRRWVETVHVWLCLCPVWRCEWRLLFDSVLCDVVSGDCCLTLCPVGVVSGDGWCLSLSCRRGAAPRVGGSVTAASVGSGMAAVPPASCYRWLSTAASPTSTPTSAGGRGLRDQTLIHLNSIFYSDCT